MKDQFAMRFASNDLVKAVLGPTNTGKTHYGIERLCAHSSGLMGFPLRLLAREVYDRVVAIKGKNHVGLITGEERIMPVGARWILSTIESMPIERDFAFVGIDEAQIGIDPERGHVFTNRILHSRGREETLILGSESMKSLLRVLIPDLELISRPRFSNLSYAGRKKLTQLPPRTAIIAFSADDVYAIAEQVRRNFGGAAIVMGGLSPQTRNAQVAMYQAGEVDYIVATDAIGMGLNLDIGHVAFASLAKFDGVRRRRLSIPEMAQIAGRAGRHQRDGTFGEIHFGAKSNPFTEEEIERIENHRFPSNQWLYWRNDLLDFSSPFSLLDSLETAPADPVLRLAPEAEDHCVLRNLVADPNLMQMAASEALTRRLWEACGLPDFRSIGPDFHARLLGRLLPHLLKSEGHIPPQMIASEVTRLENFSGAIPAISERLAAIRTWSYVSNRASWLADPAHWAERTKEIERRLSDALHLRLTERFVDKSSLRTIKKFGALTGQISVEIDNNDQVLVMGEVVGKMSGFTFQPHASARNNDKQNFLKEAEARLPALLGARARLCVEDLNTAFSLRTDPGSPPSIMWRGASLASLKRGRSFINPDILLDASVARLVTQDRAAIQNRVTPFLRSLLEERLRPIVKIAAKAFSEETPPELRAVLAPLAEDGGAVLRAELDDALHMLSPDQRKVLRQLGLTIGSLTVFHPKSLKPEVMRTRLALMAARKNTVMPPLPMPGLALLDSPSLELAVAAGLAGYYRFGKQMLRFDLLERIALKIHNQRHGRLPFVPDRILSTSIGIGEETFSHVLRALGFAPTGQERESEWRWKGLPHRARYHHRVENTPQPFSTDKFR